MSTQTKHYLYVSKGSKRIETIVVCDDILAQKVYDVVKKDSSYKILWRKPTVVVGGSYAEC